MINPDRPPIEHALKTWPPYFQEIYIGRKTFEVRRNDRDFRPFDILWLREFDPNWRGDMGERGRFTGRECRRMVGYMMRSGDPAILDMEAAHAGIAPGYVVMSLCTTPEEHAARRAASEGRLQMAAD
jgi:hypothetical protein